MREKLVGFPYNPSLPERHQKKESPKHKAVIRLSETFAAGNYTPATQLGEMHRQTNLEKVPLLGTRAEYVVHMEINSINNDVKRCNTIDSKDTIIEEVHDVPLSTDN